MHILTSVKVGHALWSVAVQGLTGVYFLFLNGTWLGGHHWRCSSLSGPQGGTCDPVWPISYPLGCSDWFRDGQMIQAEPIRSFPGTFMLDLMLRFSLSTGVARREECVSGEWMTAWRVQRQRCWCLSPCIYPCLRWVNLVLPSSTNQQVPLIFIFFPQDSLSWVPFTYNQRISKEDRYPFTDPQETGSKWGDPSTLENECISNMS